MKRQKYAILDDQDIAVPMQKLPQPKYEKTLEAQVQDGDTLQAFALRYYCTVAEIKRLNKIDKDNEIFARKILKVPITPQSILLDTSYKNNENSSEDGSSNSIDDEQLKVNKIYENLQVASTTEDSNRNQQNSINNIILNSKLKYNNYIDDHHRGNNNNTRYEDMSDSILDETIPQPRMLKGPSTSDVFDCSGSDCDMSWICLFVFILALCFAIPLIYVLYIAEHLEKYHHNAL